MAEEIIIYRNVAGEVSRDDLVDWKKYVQKLGLILDEKIRGKMTAISILQNDETITFYIYEQVSYYQLHIDYLRVKKGDGRLVQAIDWLIRTSGLRAEKFGTGRSELWRTLYVNGLVMDEGPYVERKLSADFDLRITREALMGHIYLIMDKYMQARTSGDRTLEEEYVKVLQGFVQELAKVDEILKSQNRS
ncbi:hypothetical protein [Effusibacillus lacus]|uniref:Uncharacterized protein n=1 Tax=Effusibacillus lacus TaxID=1348429 RepID=A0A292YKD1_9BACL|nr:hypothetical protein [Effusibacillus lacus]TCS70832.1 hypothetical protein EDD64_13064 [Effusibacillus lacus]GAX89371.1 hypothetical protein EFBL_0989 [Effusibacillus lacus]